MSQAPWKFPTTESVQEQKDLAGFKDWVNTDVEADANTAPLAQHLPAITEIVNSAVNVINGTEGTDEEREYIAAAALYQALRNDIAEEITTAIKTGKILLQEKPVAIPNATDKKYSFGMISMDHWRLALPQSRQQYYNCRYCEAVWVHLASVVVLSDDGKQSYPMADAFIKNGENPIVRKMLDMNPGLQKAIELRTSRNASLVPLANLSMYFMERDIGEVGKFDHFYGCDRETYAHYNSEHLPFTDFEYVQTLYKVFTDNKLDVDMLEKVFAYMDQTVGEQKHTGLSRSKDLVAAIKTVRTVKSKSTHSLIYLWGMLQRKSNRWMQHIQGTLLGIVLDTVVAAHGADDLQTLLVKAKNLIVKATDPENYKQKTAEATEGSIEQTYKYLVDNGLVHTLERRLLPLTEVKSVVWKQFEANQLDIPGEDFDENAPEPVPFNALEIARQKLKDAKNPAVAANQKMDEILNKVVTNVSMSLKQFITTLDQYAQLGLSTRTGVVTPGFVTGAVAPGDHDVLLNFDTSVNKFAHVLSPTTKYAVQQIAVMAGLSHEFIRTMTALNIDAIFYQQHSQEPQPNYVMQIDGMASVMYREILKQHGTCIVGTAIKSEHFGKSRALTELANQMEMVDDGQNAAGGVFLYPGTILEAVLKDGRKQTINITSAE